MELNQITELGQDREAALCHGLGVWDHGGDQELGTDVTGQSLSPQPVPLLHIPSKRQKIPKL